MARERNLVIFVLNLVMRVGSALHSFAFDVEGQATFHETAVPPCPVGSSHLADASDVLALHVLVLTRETTFVMRGGALRDTTRKI